MYNWSHIDEEAMKRDNPEKYRLWRIVEVINSDMLGEKLEKKVIKALWPKIKVQIDPWTRRALEYLLWGKRYSLPDNLTWWNKPPKTKKLPVGTT